MTQSNQQKSTGTLRGDQNRLIFGKGFSFSGYERDALFLSREGKKFQDISGVSGIDSITDGRGAVFADFDNDGDTDVFLTTLQGASHLLFRNNVGQDSNWLRVTLQGGKETGLDAYGAVVRVKTSLGTLTKIKAGGSGYLSQHDPRLLFGLGKEDAAQSVLVTWPNGKVEQFAGDFKANTSVVLAYGTGRAQPLDLPHARLPDPLSPTEALAQGLHIRIGEQLPEFQVTDLRGARSSIRQQLRTGRRTLVNVWATWCAPCAKEMPELQNMFATLKASGIDLVGLNVDADPNAKIQDAVSRFGVKYPILVGGQSALEKLYASDQATVPLTIVLDANGRVVDLLSGWSAETKAKLQKMIN